MPRLVIIIPFYRREELTRIVFRHYRRLQQSWPAGQVKLLAVGSEGAVSGRLAEPEGLDYLEAANVPLDAKYEQGFLAAREYRPDTVSLVGSNDMIGPEYFARALCAVTGDGVDSTGLLDCHLVDLPRHRILYWPGYPLRSRGYYRDGVRTRRGESIAAGRLFGREILDAMQWRPFLAGQRRRPSRLNDDERNIDCLKAQGATIRNWSMADVGCRFWNVKSEFDLNPLAAFERAYADELRDAGHLADEFLEHVASLSSEAVSQHERAMCPRDIAGRVAGIAADV